MEEDDNPPPPPPPLLLLLLLGWMAREDGRSIGDGDEVELEEGIGVQEPLDRESLLAPVHVIQGLFEGYIHMMVIIG